MKKLLPPVIAILLTLLLCELALLAGRQLSPWLDHQLSSPWAGGPADPVLGFRNQLFFPGHDRLGYRNPSVPESCDTLIVGDSMTYGFAASPEDSWPRQFERRTGATVYNAGVGGYGLCEYRAVFEELDSTLRPRTVIVGLFLGNDAIDTYRSVYVDDRFPSLRDDALQLDNRDLRPRSETAVDTSAHPVLEASSLYGLFRRAKWTLTESSDTPFRFSADDEGSIAQRPHRLRFKADGPLDTWFLGPQLQARSTNLRDPRIREGLRLAQLVLRELHESLTGDDRALQVVLIPSKVSAYTNIVTRHDPTLAEALQTMAEQEEELRTAWRTFLDEEGIPFADATDALRDHLARGVAVYTPTDDIHPNARGYGVIATVAAEELR